MQKNIEELTNLYFPDEGKKNNNKLNYLFNTIKFLKLDNYGKFSEKCLICGEVEPNEELITCDCCCFFNHILNVIHL